MASLQPVALERSRGGWAPSWRACIIETGWQTTKQTILTFVVPATRLLTQSVTQSHPLLRCGVLVPSPGPQKIPVSTRLTYKQEGQPTTLGIFLSILVTCRLPRHAALTDGKTERERRGAVRARASARAETQRGRVGNIRETSHKRKFRTHLCLGFFAESQSGTMRG